MPSLSEQEQQALILSAMQKDAARFSEGASEMLKCWDGLIEVSKHKLHPDYVTQNLQQQSGFSAEYLHTSRTNAENAIRGNSTRYARTDDLNMRNHPQADVTQVNRRSAQAKVDGSGNFTDAGQMKVHHRVSKYDYLAKDPDIFKKYEGVELLVPSDQYDHIRERWSNQITSLEKQCDALDAKGRSELAQAKRQELSRLKNARARLRSANVSTVEAMEARLNPRMTVIKDTVSIAHRSGYEAAKGAAITTGAINIAVGLKQVFIDDVELEVVVKEVAYKTLVSAGSAYGITAITTATAGTMQTFGNELIRNLGRTNLPSLLVQGGAILAKNTYLVLTGKMSPDEFARAATQETVTVGMSLVGGSLGAAAGGLAAGALGSSMTGACILAGSMVGGLAAVLLSGAAFNALQSSIRELDESNAHCEAMREHCELMLEQHRRYQDQLTAMFGMFFAEKEAAIKEAFSLVSTALLEGQSISPGLEMVAESLGLALTFKTDEDFADFFSSHEPLKLTR